MKKLELHLKKMHEKCIHLCTFKWASVYCIQCLVYAFAFGFIASSFILSKRIAAVVCISQECILRNEQMSGSVAWCWKLSSYYCDVNRGYRLVFISTSFQVSWWTLYCILCDFLHPRCLVKAFEKISRSCQVVNVVDKSVLVGTKSA